MAKNKVTSRKKKEIKINQSIGRNPTTYVKLYATNVIGGLSSQDFRFELLNEKIRGENKEWIYVSDGLLILSPIGAKRFLVALQQAVNVYEKQNGPIPINPKEEKMVKFGF